MDTNTAILFWLCATIHLSSLSKCKHGVPADWLPWAWKKDKTSLVCLGFVCWVFFAGTTLVPHPFWLKSQLLSFGYTSDPWVLFWLECCSWMVFPTPGPWQEQCRTAWEDCVKGNQLLVHPGFIQTFLEKPFQKLPALLPCCCRSSSAEWLMSKAENSVSCSSETWVRARELPSPQRTENCGQPVNLSKGSLWYLGADCNLRPWFNRGLGHTGP